MERISVKEQQILFESVIGAVAQIFAELEEDYSFDLRKSPYEQDIYQLVIIDDCYRHFKLALSFEHIRQLSQQESGALERFIRRHLNKQGFYLPDDPLYTASNYASGE
ncbi:hypothetical protein [Amphibacillus jilinensis]|uniref:hypothetical protein n=1 Tax=Amphibacillus jilinensis TaxID=1216008 RepID=UPI0002EF0010|nr:hypothetical protein [Amphibacillus jilinensis]